MDGEDEDIIGNNVDRIVDAIQAQTAVLDRIAIALESMIDMWERKEKSN